MKKLVSVIMPAYNNGPYISESLESVFAQTYKNVEIIVVNDGSTDDTDTIIKPYLGKIIYINQKNRGPSHARNAALKRASGEYIAFLDADDVWLPEKLSFQLSIFSEDPGTGLVCARSQLIDENGDKIDSHSKNRTVTSGHIFPQLFRKNFISTSSVIVKRECFKTVGFFDEDKENISVKDYDMWLRIASKYKVFAMKEQLFKYRIHSNSITQNIARSYYGEEKVIKKNLALFKKAYPEIKAMLPRRLAQIYYELGIEYFYIDEIENARKAFRQSLCHWPLGLRSWGYFSLSHLTLFQINLLRKFKRKFIPVKKCT